LGVTLVRKEGRTRTQDSNRGWGETPRTIDTVSNKRNLSITEEGAPSREE